MKVFSLILLIFLCLACSSKPSKEIEEERLVVSFTGDVLLDRGVRVEIERNGGNVDFLFSSVASLFKASDATVINLECPVTDSVTPINKRFIFRGDPAWLQSLKQNGVTHAVLANNHSMDQGRSGLISTKRHLDEVGIESVGYGKNKKESIEPIFITKDNIEVALLSAVRLPLENWVALDNQPSVNQASIAEICKEIKEIKTEKPKCWVVVVLHWGSEYQQHPVVIQRKEAYQLLDAGADAIIGHHPHVIQDEEIYNRKPIFYSLGNFVFDQNKHFTNKGLIVQLIFDKDGLSFEKHPVDIKRCKPYLQNQ